MVCALGGGKGGKSLTTLEKRQKKVMEEQLKQQLKKSAEAREKKTQLTKVDSALLNRVSKELSGLNVVTPYIIASKVGVNISLAKRIIKELIAQGKLQLIDKSRRLLIAIPKSS